MTLRKLRLQARYNVLTPAALIGLTSALLMGAPAFAAAQTNTGNVPSILIGAGNAFTNTGTITTDNANPAVYSSTDIESFLNTGTGAIVGESYTGVDINGNVNGAFTNNGSISSTNEAGVDINGDVNGAFTNTGLISGSWAGVYVSGDVTGAFTNSGTLTAGYSYDAYAAEVNGDVGSFTNSNTIMSAYAYNGAGVYITGSVDGAFNNSGTISSSHAYDGYGVHVIGDVGSFVNSNSISAASNEYGYGVYIGGHVNNFTNSGSIAATGNTSQGYGVFLGDVGNFTNSGTISLTDNNRGYAIWISNHADSFTNSGTISATNNDSSGYGVRIGGGVDQFVNTGRIDAYYTAVSLYGTVGSFNNSGTISSTTDYGVAIYGDVPNFTNSGTISGDTYGVYISSGVPTSFMNSGTIAATGTTGVYFSGSDSTLTNSGRISGGTYAVVFNGSNNTLKVLTGGTFVGGVSFDSGTDMFDFSQFHGNMILEEYNTLPTGNVVPGDNLYLQDSHQVIIVGDSSVTNSSHPVSDITNGINNLITNQLDFGSGGGGDGAPLGFAPVRVNSAAEMATAKAMAPKVQDGQVFWAQGIGGGSSNGVDASDVFGALVVGTHVQLQDGLKAGGLGAYAHSIATTDSSQTITADTGIIGAYGRAELDTISLDFSILAGASTNASARTIAGPGGPETASATFGGWFINPTIGVSMPVLSSDKGDLSVIGSVGYLFGGFGGYTETGSSANLTVGAQTIGILDAAFGVKGKKDIGSNEHGVIVGKGTAELFAESNMGTSSVPISVLGTTIGNSLPPTALALGVRSSLSVEVPISDSVSFTGGGSVSLRTDGLISGAATAKISGSF